MAKKLNKKIKINIVLFIIILIILSTVSYFVGNSFKTTDIGDKTIHLTSCNKNASFCVEQYSNAGTYNRLVSEDKSSVSIRCNPEIIGELRCGHEIILPSDIANVFDAKEHIYDQNCSLEWTQVQYVNENNELEPLYVDLWICNSEGD